MESKKCETEIAFDVAYTYIVPIKRLIGNTVCPGSSDPFYIASLLYKMGHYFLDILYRPFSLD